MNVIDQMKMRYLLIIAMVIWVSLWWIPAQADTIFYTNVDGLISGDLWQTDTTPPAIVSYINNASTVAIFGDLVNPDGTHTEQTFGDGTVPGELLPFTMSIDANNRASGGLIFRGIAGTGAGDNAANQATSSNSERFRINPDVSDGTGVINISNQTGANGSVAGINYLLDVQLQMANVNGGGFAGTLLLDGDGSGVVTLGQTTPTQSTATYALVKDGTSRFDVAAALSSETVTSIIVKNGSYGVFNNNAMRVVSGGTVTLGNAEPGATGEVRMVINGGRNILSDFIVAASDGGTQMKMIEVTNGSPNFGNATTPTNITLNDDLFWSQASGTGRIHGTISGAGHFTFRGPSNIEFFADNSGWGSGITVEGGQLRLMDANAAGDGTITLSTDAEGVASQLRLFNGITIANDLLVEAGDGGRIVMSQDATDVSVNGNITIAKVIQFRTNEGTINVNGQILEDPAALEPVNVTKGGGNDGIGTLFLNNQNTFTGQLNINRDAAVLNHALAADLASLVLIGTGGSIEDAELVLNVEGMNLTPNVRAMQPDPEPDPLVLEEFSARTLRVGDDADNVTVNGVQLRNMLNIDTPEAQDTLSILGRIEDNDGGMNYSGGINKVGDGMLLIDGDVDHTFTGPLNVDFGMALVNDTFVSAGVNVAAGATLGGNGSIGGAVSVGGSLAPGNSVGTIEVASILFGPGSSFDVEIDGAAADLLNVLVGDLTIDPTATLNFSTSGVLEEETYLLAETFLGLRLGEFGTVTGLPTGYDLVYTGTTIELNAQAVEIPEPAIPEPASLTLMLLGMAGLMRRRQH